MTREDFNSFCRSLPHASHVLQWGGSDVWKVGDAGQSKVFAIGNSGIAGEAASTRRLRISFKCSRMSFDMLKEAPGFQPAPYLASRGMVWLQRTSPDSMDDASFTAYLAESHRLMSLTLTKARQRALGLDQVQ